MDWPPRKPLPSDAAARRVVTRVLEPGEELLWAGKCDDTHSVDRRLLWPELATPGCVFGGCAALVGVVLLIAAVTGEGLALMEGLVGLIFLAFGRANLFGLPGNARMHRNAVYAITDHRALVVSRKGSIIKAYPAVDPLGVASEPSWSGLGDLLFDSTSMKGSEASVLDGFLGIPDVEHVERLLLATAIRSSARTAPGRSVTNDGDGLSAKERQRAAQAASHAAAIRQLGTLDEDAFEATAERVESANPDEVVLFTQMLGIIGMWRTLGPRALKFLLWSQHSRLTGARSAADTALRRLGASVMPLLVRAWAAEDAGFQDLARKTLQHLDDHILASGFLSILAPEDEALVGAADAFRRGYCPLRRRVVKAWAQASAPMPERIGALFQHGPSWGRMWAAEALCLRAARDCQGISLAHLTAGLSADDAPAAVLLAHTGDAAGVPALIRCVESDDPEACQIAAGALARLGAAAEAALPALYRAAREAQDGEAHVICRVAAEWIARALRGTSAELQAGTAPAGLGTELEAGRPPAGRGTEPEAVPTTDGAEAPPVSESSGAAAEHTPPPRESPGRG